MSEKEKRKIQIISDIHLELLSPTTYKSYKENNFEIFFGNKQQKEKKDILVLAGDIGNPFSETYVDFISFCANTWNHIIIVSGNHEYYTHGQSIMHTNKRIRRIAEQYQNVHYLGVDNMIDINGVSIIIDDIKFIGTTLWTMPPTKKDFWEKKEKYIGLNDFSCIANMSREIYKELHLLHKDTIRKELHKETEKDYSIVVVTHHLPCREMIRRDKYNPCKLFEKYYYADCRDILDMLSEQCAEMGKKGLWICGHSHMSNKYTHKNIEIYCNPFGYKGEKTEYDSTLLLEI